MIIIPCGAAKKRCDCPAGQMYIGAYHKMCRRYANALHQKGYGDIYILSAKYGFLKLTDIISPYTKTFGQPDCITVDEVRQQAINLQIIDYPVIAIGGRRYVDVIKQIWKDVKDPLAGKGGNGKQMGFMKSEIERLAK